jgi:hypothetical protein
LPPRWARGARPPPADSRLRSRRRPGGLGGVAQRYNLIDALWTSHATASDVMRALRPAADREAYYGGFLAEQPPSTVY